MSATTILIGIWIAIIGICGLAQTLCYHEMIDAINTQRPPGDQIPVIVLSWSDVRKSFECNFWFVRSEFRRLFPNRRTCFWHTVTIAVMIASGLVGLIACSILGVF